ncbi:MAG: PDZ domain-containing protein [Acidimicrobiales bacterium]
MNHDNTSPTSVPTPTSDQAAVPNGDDLPVPPPQNLARVQRRLMKITAAVIILMMIIGIAAGFLFRTNYVAFVPGSSRDTEPFLTVSGITDYPSDGELHLTTVRVRDRVSLWGYLWYQIDDDAELVQREQVFGTRTSEENREINLERMASSKDLAAAVALERLGYDTIVSDGVFVLETVENTPAAEVLERGDVIVSLQGEEVVSPSQLVEAIGGRAPGDFITIGVERATTGQVEEIQVTLIERDDDASRAFLGVATSERVDLDLDVGFDVELGSDNIGGPSAGLAFTLAVLDQLTPGELTGGERVAVTGTIQVDGSVGSVGGVEQKAAAVRDEGVKVFIVPTALEEPAIERVREAAGDGVQVLPVDDLEDALDALAGLGGDVNAIEEFAAAVTAG